MPVGSPPARDGEQPPRTSCRPPSPVALGFVISMSPSCRRRPRAPRADSRSPHLRGGPGRRKWIDPSSVPPAPRRTASGRGTTARGWRRRMPGPCHHEPRCTTPWRAGRGAPGSRGRGASSGSSVGPFARALVRARKRIVGRRPRVRQKNRHGAHAGVARMTHFHARAPRRRPDSRSNRCTADGAKARCTASPSCTAGLASMRILTSRSPTSTSTIVVSPRSSTR